MEPSHRPYAHRGLEHELLQLNLETAVICTTQSSLLYTLHPWFLSYIMPVQGRSSS